MGEAILLHPHTPSWHIQPLSTPLGLYGPVKYRSEITENTRVQSNWRHKSIGLADWNSLKWHKCNTQWNAATKLKCPVNTAGHKNCEILYRCLS